MNNVQSAIHLKKETQVQIPTKYGPAYFVTFSNLPESSAGTVEPEHFALVFDGPSLPNCPWVRIHSECITGDLFGSEKCDCGDQLDEALKKISRDGGVLIYLRQEGRGIGLRQKLKAYELQNQGFDTFQANRALGFEDDLRSFDYAAHVLKALNVSSLKLLTNNPEKESALRDHGLTLESVESTKTFVKSHNFNYLLTKKIKAGHRFALAHDIHAAAMAPLFAWGDL